MGKSSTKSAKLFDNNNENIKTIEKLLQVKTSDLSIIPYLHHCSKVIIRQYSNVKCWRCTVNDFKRMTK